LESVALIKEQEDELSHDLNTFLEDRDFYSRVGLPYRRGYLFYGKPGTGKTSLVNAISAQLNRDVYYLNLRNIKSDSMLQSAFSRVPANQVIVFEDVDA
ncbi:P-loop containing nucleoside triphosphate hydrolase protein, partial [Thamnocephalis sphaerospora]